jgi:hypothetical protein
MGLSGIDFTTSLRFSLDETARCLGQRRKKLRETIHLLDYGGPQGPNSSRFPFLKPMSQTPDRNPPDPPATHWVINDRAQTPAMIRHDFDAVSWPWKSTALLVTVIIGAVLYWALGST